MGVNLRNNLNKMLNLNNEQTDETSVFRNKMDTIYGINKNTYNPFLNKNGNIFNPYIDYQRILDNPNIAQKAKNFITQATGLTPTQAQANNDLNYANYTQSSGGNQSDSFSTDSSLPKATAQQNINTAQTGNSFVNTAKKFLGTPYVWGGTSPKGFDCSGLMQYVYAQNGIKLPRTAREQFKGGSTVSKENLQPGDLVFFKGYTKSAENPGHVGMYIGNGEYIQAPKTGDVVKISKLSGRSDYVGARRYY